MNLVIGMGEVGRALSEYLDCPGRDVTPIPVLVPVDILHVAIPYSDGFTRYVSAYEAVYRPDVVVVHSTVPVGTCDPHGWVHSPVRGRHPNLVAGLEAFRKSFGGTLAQKAAEAWPGDSEYWHRAAETEAGKLWELAQFGLQVRVTQAIYDYCTDNDLNPDVVYRMFAESYNQGYSKLGDDQFIRPILEHVPGPIGGHCVTENMEWLNHQVAELVKHGV